MAKELRNLAEDLEKVFGDIKPKPVVRPSVTKAEDIYGVARALYEYVLHRAPEDASPSVIGNGLVVGVQAAAQELGIKPRDLMRAVESYVIDTLASARETLAETE